MTTHRPLCAVFLMAVALSALATSGRAQATACTGGFQSFIGFDPYKHVGAVLINTRSGTRSDVLDIGTHSTS